VSERHIPRLVIAGTASGVGKTTAMVALCRALRQRGISVAVFKVGPDYLDPTYHWRAAGMSSHTLDGWMMNREAVLDTFTSVAHNADVALIEGVMGLFDGAAPTSEEGSTAQVAKWLKAPVVLVIDASGMARTVAAIAEGCAAFDPDVNVAGVLCNRVGSRGHLNLLKTALQNIPLVGGFQKEPSLRFPERHLGLYSAIESGLSDALFDEWGRRASEWLDLDRLLAIAKSAEEMCHTGLAAGSPPIPPRCRIGYALDEAFHFYYEANLRYLRDAGAELVRFSPIHDEHLPAVDGLYFGGGYPELHAKSLSANASMRREIVAFAAGGGPVYGECGGLIYLSERLQTTEGSCFEMVNLIPGEVIMSDRLQALGYVEVQTIGDSILGPSGLNFRGHQFRYSNIQGLPPDLDCTYELAGRRTAETRQEGYRSGTALASYVHAHWASNPEIPQNFVAKCADYAQQRHAEAIWIRC
jgi:cobyrinic acid a,c-diamide synthase